MLAEVGHGSVKLGNPQDTDGAFWRIDRASVDEPLDDSGDLDLWLMAHDQPR
jgi:hypothetical protein